MIVILGVKETITHIEKILIVLEGMNGSNAFMTLVKWILWGFGSSNIKEIQWSDKNK